MCLLHNSPISNTTVLRDDSYYLRHMQSSLEESNPTLELPENPQSLSWTISSSPRQVVWMFLLLRAFMETLSRDWRGNSGKEKTFTSFPSYRASWERVHALLLTEHPSLRCQQLSSFCFAKNPLGNCHLWQFTTLKILPEGKKCVISHWWVFCWRDQGWARRRGCGEPA